MYHDYSAPARVAAIPTLQSMVAAAGTLPPGGYGTYDRPTVAFVRMRSGSGFNHTTAPRTRAERRHLTNRETMEKERLRNRREKFTTYQESGSIIRPDAIDSALYMADTDRFFTDVAAEQRHLRQEMLQKKQAEVLRKRTDAAAREEARWAEMEAQARAFDEKTLQLQADGRPALKNKNGQPFNPVTQAYTNGTDGAVLQYLDERTKWKAAVRAEYLSNHSSGSSFNPLTGGDIHHYKAPPPPRPQDSGVPNDLSIQEAMALGRKYRSGP